MGRSIATPGRRNCQKALKFSCCRVLLGDNWTTALLPSIGATAPAISGASIGQNTVNSSQAVSAQSADVAGDLMIVEKVVATASQRRQTRRQDRGRSPRHWVAARAGACQDQ